MSSAPDTGEARGADPEGALRRSLLALLAFGMVGTATELLLLGHTEKRMQLVPLVVLGVGLLATALVTIRTRSWSVQALACVMAIFVLTGLLGMYNHYRGNVEFELELYPSIAGWELFSKAVTGATPALAPGTMVVLGLLGLAYCHWHPTLQTASIDATTSERSEGASR